jgi:pilus assembly protein CpaE
MSAITAALVIGTKELRAEVQSCLRGLPVQVVLDQPGVTDMDALVDRLERVRPSIVLLDVGPMQGSLEAAVPRIKSISSEPSIIALHTSAESDVLLRALRAGVNEFLCPPVKDGLHNALERLHTHQAKQRDNAPRKGRVMAFTSVKGGCGATTIACHMAAEMGRCSNQHGLLADLDLGSGTVRFVMKSGSPYSLRDAVNNLHRLDISYWKALTSNGRPGLEIIGAPDILSSDTPPEPQQVREVIHFVRAHYDWVLLDLGRSLSAVSMGILNEIDEFYVVTTMEVPALYRTRQVVRALLEAGYETGRIHPILNRAPLRLDVTAEELEEMLGRPIYAMLPNDYAGLYESYLEGKLVSPGSSLGKYITRFAEKLVPARAEQA